MKANLKGSLIARLALMISALTAFIALSSSMFSGEVGFSMIASGIPVKEQPYYVDILLKLTGDEEWYTDFNTSSGTSIHADSELAAYNEDGFRSVLMHFKGSSSWDGESVFIYNWSEQRSTISRTNAHLRNLYPEARIAVVDHDGNFLYISDTFRLHENYTSYTYDYNYHADTNTVEIRSLVPSDLDNTMFYMDFIVKICAALSAVILIVFVIRKCRSILLTVLAGIAAVPSVGTFFALAGSFTVYFGGKGIMGDLIISYSKTAFIEMCGIVSAAIFVLVLVLTIINRRKAAKAKQR